MITFGKENHCAVFPNAIILIILLFSLCWFKIPLIFLFANAHTTCYFLRVKTKREDKDRLLQRLITHHAKKKYEEM